jgi:hypothetical protein
MYSPYAVAGSISFVIRVRSPSDPTWTFISSSASTLSASTASRISGPRASSSVCSTDTGWTVSPLTMSAPSVMWSRAVHIE